MTPRERQSIRRILRILTRMTVAIQLLDARLKLLEKPKRGKK